MTGKSNGWFLCMELNSLRLIISLSSLSTCVSPTRAFLKYIKTSLSIYLVNQLEINANQMCYNALCLAHKIIPSRSRSLSRPRPSNQMHHPQLSSISRNHSLHSAAIPKHPFSHSSKPLAPACHYPPYSSKY